MGDLVSISDLLGNDGLFCDGDWIESKDQDQNGEVRLIQLADIGVNEFRDKSNRFLNLETAKRLNCTYINKGDIILARMPDPIGRACLFPLEGLYVTAVDVAIIRVDKSIVDSKWLTYRINSTFFRNQIAELASGTTRQRITRKNIDTIKFNLPPLREQQRIVAKLDTFFAHLEEVKQRMEQIPMLLKQFRQAVLTQAVTGKLTEEWRVGKELEEWETKRIGEISDSLSGYAFKSSDFTTSGIQLIRMGNLYGNSLDLSRNPVFLPLHFDTKILQKYLVKKDDILLTLTGTKYKRDYGFAIKVENEEKLLLNQRILALRPKVDKSFLLFALRQDIFRDQFFECETGGVNQGNVGVKSLLDIELEIPPTTEQTEIVRRVETLFSKADAIEARYKKMKAQIDQLPQAILAKAFRGEL